MICKNCGAEISEGLIFCPKCSCRIQSDINNSVQDKSAKNFTSSGFNPENKNYGVPPSYSSPYPTYNSYNSYTAPGYTYNEKSSHKGLVISIAIIAIIAFILITFKISQNYFKFHNLISANSLFSQTRSINTEIDIQGKWTGTDADNLTTNLEINITDLSINLPETNIHLDKLNYEVTKHDKKIIEMKLIDTPSVLAIDNLHFVFLDKDTVIFTITGKNGTQGAVKLHRVK